MHAGKGQAGRGEVPGRDSLHAFSSISRPTLFSLVLSLIRKHRASYAVMGLSTFLASLLTSSTMQVYQAGKSFDNIGDLNRLNTYQRLQAKVPYSNLSMVTIPALACCLLVSVFLVLSSVTFLIQERRREYAMMRLNGASRRRILIIGILEFSIPLALSNLIGCLVGSLLTIPVGRFYARSAEFSDSGMVFTPRIRPSIAVVTFIMMMVACLLGVWMAMRKVGWAAPLQLMTETSDKTKRIGWIRSSAALVFLILTLVVGFAPLPSMTLDLRIMLEVILVITTVYLAAPILVVLTVSVIGLIPAKVAGGPGLLALQRARKESAGSTAIALPAMMILTIVISLVAAMQAGSIGGAVLSLYPLKADVMATSLDSDAQNRNPSDLIGGMPEVRDFVTYQTQQWAMEGSPGQTATVVWEPAEQLQGQKVQSSPSIHFSFVQGNSSDLGSDRVAVNQDSSYSIGDTVRLLDRHDQPHEVRVVALVQSPEGIPELSAGNNYPLFLTAEDDLPQLGEDAHTIIPISAVNPTDAHGITSRLKSGLQGDFAVQTRQEYIDDFIQRGLSGQTAMTVMIVGGTVLALIFMMQSIAISAWERKRQNQRLNQIGVAWRSIAWSGMIETLTDVAGGAVMALLGIAIVEGCIALSFVQAGMSMALTPVPVGRFLLVTVVLLLVAVFTSWVCSLRSRKAEEG